MPGANRDIADRSYLLVTPDDLRRLAKIAADDLRQLFERNEPLRRLYLSKYLCTALCQGAALHVVDGKNGIKDWDVWTFFRRHPERQFPPRRRVERSFGDPRFGRLTRTEHVGRCVDLLGRAIECDEGADPSVAIRKYLRDGRTKSAQLLAMKAVILLDPEHRCGEVVWPEGTEPCGLASAPD